MNATDSLYVVLWGVHVKSVPGPVEMQESALPSLFFSCHLGTSVPSKRCRRTAGVRESSGTEAHWGVRDQKLKLTGLGAVGRCEPGECTSHRNRRSVRRFLSRPTNRAQRRKRGKSGQRAAFLLRRMDCLLMSAEIPPRWIRRSYTRSSWPDIWPQSCTDSPGTSFVTTALIHLLTIPSFTGASTHLGSVDLHRDVVSLRRPLGGFRHFEARADEINTELALDREKRHVEETFCFWKDLSKTLCQQFCTVEIHYFE